MPPKGKAAKGKGAGKPKAGGKRGASKAPAPNSAQLAIEGFKPAAINEVEKTFEGYMAAKFDAAEAIEARGDAKERLKRAMQKHKVPHYGKKYGKKTWVASIVKDEDVNVKAQTKDREA